MFLAIASVVIFVTKFHLLSYGFDITDEGFYLASMDSPSSYPNTTSKFGFLLSSFLAIFDHDLISIRVVTWLVMSGLTFVLFLQVLSFRKSELDLSSTEVILLSYSFATTVFLLVPTWLVTPSYNTIAFMSVLLFGIGTGVVFKGARVSGLVVGLSSTCIAISGVLAFFVKGTVAVALASYAVVLLLVLMMRGKLVLSIRVAVFSGVIASLLVMAGVYYVSGGFFAFFEGVFEGRRLAKLLIGDSWGELVSILWNGNVVLASEVGRVPFFLFVGGLIVLLSSLQAIEQLISNRVGVKLIRSLILLLVVFLSCASIALIFRAPHIEFVNVGALKPFERWLFLWFPCFAALICLVIKKFRQNFNYDSICLPLLFLALPYSFVIGTTNNYWGVLASASLFGFLFCICVARSAYSVYLSASIGMLLVTISSPHVSKNFYRQPSSLASGSSIEFREITSGRLSGILVDPAVSSYYESLELSAVKSGFVRGQTVIDLTGASPGAIYAMGGVGLSVAWLIGGYPGSHDFAKEALSMESEVALRGSWVLLEYGYRSFNPALLNDFDRELNRDYMLVDSFDLPSGYGGRKKETKQYLYRPR